MNKQCYCANSSCQCHKDPKFKVFKPVFVGSGPHNCCNICLIHVYMEPVNDRLDNLPGFE